MAKNEVKPAWLDRVRTKIEVRVFPCTGPNGDRDTKSHPYLDYEIWMIYQGPAKASKKEVCLKKVSGFDSWYSHIRDKKEVKKEVETYTKELWDFFGLHVDQVEYEHIHVPEVKKTQVRNVVELHKGKW